MVLGLHVWAFSYSKSVKGKKLEQFVRFKIENFGKEK